MGIEQAVNQVLEGVGPRYGECMFRIIYDSRKITGPTEEWDDYGKEVRKIVRRLRRQGIIQTVGGGGGKNTRYALVELREAFQAEKKAAREEKTRQNAQTLVVAVLVAASKSENEIDALIEAAEKLGLKLRF